MKIGLSCDGTDQKADINAGIKYVQSSPRPSPRHGHRFEEPPPSSSWLMPLFIVANTISFAYTMYVNDCPFHHPPRNPNRHRGGGGCILHSFLGRFSFEPLSVNMLLGPSAYTLDSLGALDYNKIVVEGESWRLISCMWLHGGLVHLFANMLSLVFLGVRLEQEFGYAKIGSLYVLSGFGGSLMSCLFIQENISVGASGALFGLLGAMLSELIINWSIYANKCSALSTLIVVITINMAIGMVPHVDSSAHIGGFLAGFLLGFVLLIRPQFGWVGSKNIPPGYKLELLKPKYKTYQLLLWYSALIILLTWFLRSLVNILKSKP